MKIQPQVIDFEYNKNVRWVIHPYEIFPCKTIIDKIDNLLRKFFCLFFYFLREENHKVLSTY